jgi:hypothetical protein
MRIIRTIVVLAAAAIFMPSPPEDRLGAMVESDPPATELLSAAFSTVADMGDFCSRQAGVCDTAHYLAIKFERKARYSAELLYQWLQEKNGSAGLSGSTLTATDEARSGRNTLQLEDLIPEWRAPKSERQS